VEDQTIKTGVAVNRIFKNFLMGCGSPFSEVNLSFPVERDVIFRKLFCDLFAESSRGECGGLLFASPEPQDPCFP
jgi:hypothetical protein